MMKYQETFVAAATGYFAIEKDVMSAFQKPDLIANSVKHFYLPHIFPEPVEEAKEQDEENLEQNDESVEDAVLDQEE